MELLIQEKLQFWISVKKIFDGYDDRQAEGRFGMQIKHRNTIVKVPHKRIEPVPVVNTPFKFSRTSPDSLGPAPDLGEHTEEVLVNIAKYSLEKINDLIENGVIDSDYSE